jgi:hypothetical protein
VEVVNDVAVKLLGGELVVGKVVSRGEESPSLTDKVTWA